MYNTASEFIQDAGALHIARAKYKTSHIQSPGVKTSVYMYITLVWDHAARPYVLKLSQAFKSTVIITN